MAGAPWTCLETPSIVKGLGKLRDGRGMSRLKRTPPMVDSFTWDNGQWFILDSLDSRQSVTPLTIEVAHHLFRTKQWYDFSLTPYDDVGEDRTFGACSGTAGAAQAVNTAAPIVGRGGRDHPPPLVVPTAGVGAALSSGSGPPVGDPIVPSDATVPAVTPLELRAPIPLMRPLPWRERVALRQAPPWWRNPNLLTPLTCYQWTRCPFGDMTGTLKAQASGHSLRLL